MSLAEPLPWLLVVAALHLGFQLTVDLVVYPALGDVPDERWATAHQKHSSRITPVVAVAYLPLVGVLAWSVATRPEDAGVWLAVAGAALSVGTTAVVAAPTHGRLSSEPAAGRPALLGRLDRADRVRTLGAAVCLVGALLAG
ncbi:hypothetical protein [Nocardioides palaemonis]|uniref:hypothetical protein n=1 Tax=Nocardioides palaemonis TaxID=2829810 RepID=UPI0027DB2523|nr:hypothetical protein [Nocardioides palaemonis]